MASVAQASCCKLACRVQIPKSRRPSRPRCAPADVSLPMPPQPGPIAASRACCVAVCRPAGASREVTVARSTSPGAMQSGALPLLPAHTASQSRKLGCVASGRSATAWRNKPGSTEAHAGGCRCRSSQVPLVAAASRSVAGVSGALSPAWQAVWYPSLRIVCAYFPHSAESQCRM